MTIIRSHILKCRDGVIKRISHMNRWLNGFAMTVAIYINDMHKIFCFLGSKPNFGLFILLPVVSIKTSI